MSESTRDNLNAGVADRKKNKKVKFLSSISFKIMLLVILAVAVSSGLALTRIYTSSRNQLTKTT